MAIYAIGTPAVTFNTYNTTADDPSSTSGTIVSETGLAVAETGNNVVHKTVFTFTNVIVPLTDDPGVSAFGSLQLYDFPEGGILINSTVVGLTVEKTTAGVNDDWDSIFGVGTDATGSGSGTITGTATNFLTSSVALDQAVSGATTVQTENGTVNFSTEGIETGPLGMYVNFKIADADHNVTATPCNLMLNGTVTIIWSTTGAW